MLPFWCSENKAALLLSPKRWWIDLDQNKLSSSLILEFYSFLTAFVNQYVVAYNLFREEIQKERNVQNRSTKAKGYSLGPVNGR